jgi:hypothetical protein
LAYEAAFFSISRSYSKNEKEKSKKIDKKVKKNFGKTLSPASVDKSVNNDTLPLKFGALLYLKHVFA